MPPPIIPYLSEESNRLPEKPVIRGLTLPVIDMPNPTLNYPVIDVPTQEEFDAAVKAEQKKKEQEQEEKSRGLPDSKPVLPQVQVPVQNSQDNRNLSDQPPTSNLGVPEIQVPFVGPVPVPPKEQVILAGTTATASVAAALVGKSLVEWMVKKFKPVVERIFAQLNKMRKKDLTEYEIQLIFAYEKNQQMKKVNKLLKKEQKKQKLDQYKKANNK